VLGHAVGTDKDSNSSAEGAFQAYTVVLAHMAAPIPDTMSFEQAAVLPLAWIIHEQFGLTRLTAFG